MLTTADLSAIRKITREEVENEAKSTRHEITMVKMDLASRIHKLEDRLKNVEIQTGRIEKDIELLKKIAKRLEKNIEKSVNFLDKDFLSLKKRVDRVEVHIGIAA